MDPACKAEVSKLFHSSLPVNQKLQQILTCLSKAGLVHETILKPEDILVHEANQPSWSYGQWL